ncbi:MAG: helix-turn-helix transcriptional regulator [Propioniciclava sp.]|uniref:helix-turn-helix transcriptional regulator n=1 Tax=Propioniciclava sp. TaxID=2038686 RepID=UPI0039E4F727
MPSSEFDLSRLRWIFNRRRAEAGLTYEQLAELSGVSRQTLLNLASGKYNGDLQTWLRLSVAFGVGMDELLAEVWLTRPPGTVRDAR